MADRIDNPWGERTPRGPRERWPDRVDVHLADGLTEPDVDRWVRTASILRPTGDAIDIAVNDGRTAGVRGRAADRDRLAVVRSGEREAAIQRTRPRARTKQAAPQALVVAG